MDISALEAGAELPDVTRYGMHAPFANVGRPRQFCWGFKKMGGLPPEDRPT